MQWLLLLSLVAIGSSSNSSCPSSRGISSSLSVEALSEGFEKESRAAGIVERLLENFGPYGKFVYPAIGSNRSQVNMSFQILHFYGLDEKEILEIGVWTAFLWHDPRLVWDPSDLRGVRVLKVPADKIWVPDIGLSNTKKENQFDFRLLKAVEALVYPNGTVYIYYHLVTNVACPIDVTFFPFDSQQCDFQLGPWTSYRGSYRIHLPESSIRKANISKFVSEWDVISFSIEEKNFFDDNVNQMWDYFEVRLEVRRKPYYYIFVIVVPFFMLSFMACLMFLADEAGDRVSMSIAILLTMTLYVMITSSSAPKSMQTIPLLGIYIMIQMGLLIFFTFLAIKGDFFDSGHRAHTYRREDANGLVTMVTERRPRSYSNRGTRRGLAKQECFFMAVYVGLTLTNVCVCMIILPAAKRKM